MKFTFLQVVPWLDLLSSEGVRKMTTRNETLSQLQFLPLVTAPKVHCGLVMSWSFGLKKQGERILLGSSRLLPYIQS